MTFDKVDFLKLSIQCSAWQKKAKLRRTNSRTNCQQNKITVCQRVLEAGEGFLDVPWHGEVDFPSLSVSLNGESAVSFAFPVAGAFVIFLYCV
jgi:hypothetical protein